MRPLLHLVYEDLCEQYAGYRTAREAVANARRAQAVAERRIEALKALIALYEEPTP